MDTKPKPSGVDGLGDLSLGTHFCVFYETEQDLLDILAFYFKPGLANHEFCLWLAPDSSTQEARSALNQVIPSADQHLEAGDIEIVSCQQFYCPDDVFDAAKILQSFHLKIVQALEKGYARVRVLGDESWLEKEDWKAFYDYEGKIDESLTGKPISILCAYTSANFNAADLFDIAQTHDFIAAKRNGNWQLLESPTLKQVKADTEKDINAPDHQVNEQKGEELATRNQLLQAEIIERKRREEALQMSEARLQAAIHAADIGLWDWNLISGQITWFGHHEQLFGFAPGEFDGAYASFENRVHPDDLAELNRDIQRAQEERSEYAHEYRIIWPDGSVHWISGRGRFIYDPTGRPVRMYGAVHDITGRKQAEAALKETSLRLQVALQAAQIGTGEWDIQTGQATLSDGLRRIFGFPLGTTQASFEEFIERIHPEDREQYRSKVDEALAGKTDFGMDYRTVWPDSSIHWITARTHISFNHSGKPTRLVGAAMDISDRKQAEEALRKSERVLREAEELGHTGSWEQDLVTGEIFNTDENLRLFFGNDRTKGAFFEDYEQVVHPDDREYVLQRNRQLLIEGGPGDIEYRVVWPDGSIHVIFGRATVVRDASDQPVRVYGTNVDITERKRAEDSLRESQQLLRLVLATLPVGVMVIDRDGDIILVNEAWKRIWGGAIVSGRERWAQIKGFWHASGERIAPADWASMRALSAGQTSLNELIDIETYDDQRKTIHNSVAPIRNPEERIVGAVMVNEDVTERVRAEEETIRQSAHAEALARIAARLNRQLDLDTVVHAVCQEVVDTFKASQATMTLYDKESDLLAYTGGVNIPPEYAATIEPTARTKFDELLRAMGPIMVIPDIQSMPDAPNAEFNSHFDVRTVVTAAMLRDDELIGVVALGVNGHIREFSIDELTLLKAISDQAAQALANAQLLKAAEKQHEQLRALSVRLVETQETERRAIARELHDDIGQTLTGLMMQLGTAKSHLPKSARSAQTLLEGAETLVQEILGRTRAIITGLRPQVLDDLGLVPAVRRLANEFQEETGTVVEIKTDHIPKRLPAPLELALYRIIQEGLTNVHKHTQAHLVSIALAKEDGQVTLSIRDDGRGFEKQRAGSPTSGEIILEGGWRIPEGHFGLIGIQERAAQLGGALQVTSAPGQGTTLRVELPLSEEKVG